MRIGNQCNKINTFYEFYLHIIIIIGENNLEEFNYRENYWRVFSKRTTIAMWIFEAILSIDVFTFMYESHQPTWLYFCIGIGLGCLHASLSSFRRIITQQDYIIDAYNKTVSDVIEKAKEITLEEIISDSDTAKS